MNLNYNYLSALMLVCGLVVQESPAQSANPKAQTNLSATELQMASVMKMQQSIVLQKASVEKQMSSALASGFALASPIHEGVSAVSSADCERLPGPVIDSLITRAATAQRLDPDLLRSVMRQESGFRPCSVSSKGAMGLMQLMPATAEQFGLKDPFDPSTNVNAGAELLKQLVTRYAGDLSLALGAYNAGTGAVDSAGAVPNNAETTSYVQKILSTLPAKQNTSRR